MILWTHGAAAMNGGTNEIYRKFYRKKLYSASIYIKNTVYECHVAYNNIVEGFSIMKVLKVKMGKNPNFFLHLLLLNSFLASNIVFVAENALQITV